MHDRLEASLKQSLRIAEAAGGHAGIEVGAHANLLLCYVIGRWQLFAKSRFKRTPSEQWDAQRALLLG